MTTQEYIDKIKAIAQGARAFHETHGVTVGVLNPSWLRKVPLAQFVELCDTFPHDPVKCDTWPLAWLKVDGIDICMWGADKVPQAPPPPPQPSSLDYLRECQLDYEDALNDAGFRIRNPNAARSCGCGTSFEPAQ